jgi:MFS family permease
MAAPSTHPQASPRLFFGWYVVASAFLVMFVGFGVNYTFGPFLDPLRKQFGASKTEVSGLFDLMALIYFTLGALTGPLSDRVGPRRLGVAGGLLIGGGLLLTAHVTALWQMYLTYSVCVGAGIGCVYVPSVSAVQQWFHRRRGFATGVAVAGIGAGTLAGPPIAAYLLAALGWRSAYTVLGVAALALIGIAVLRLERSPAARGLAPDGERPTPSDGPARSLPRETSPVYTTRAFWLLYASCFFSCLAVFVPAVHLVSYAKSEGISATGAAWILGLIGVGSASGRLFLGTAADRLGRRRSLGGAYAFMAVMLAWWLVSHSAWQLAIFAVGFGLGYGGFVALLPAITADYFGALRAGAIIGLLYTSAGIGSFFGPIAAARIFDATGAYTIAILAGIAANLLAVASVVLLDPPERVHAAALRRHVVAAE